MTLDNSIVFQLFVICVAVGGMIGMVVLCYLGDVYKARNEATLERERRAERV